MTSTTPKPGARPGDRLRAHADDLRSGRLTWVGREPEIGEACIQYVGGSREVGPIELFTYDGDEYAALSAACGGDPVAFNDTDCTLPKAIRALEEAADLLDKEGK